MGRIIRQRPVPLSELAGGVVLEEQGGAVLVRSGGWPGVTIGFDNGSELFRGESSFDAVDGALIVRNFERLFVTFPENVGPLDLELELFPCGIVSLTPGRDNGDPPVRVRFPMIEFTALELVGASQPLLVADLGAASESLGGSLTRPYYLTDQYVGGIVQADETFILDFYAYRNATQDAATAVLVGSWSVGDSATSTRAGAVLEEGGMLRALDSIRMSGPTLIPPFGGFFNVRTVGSTDIHNLSVLLYTRSR